MNFHILTLFPDMVMGGLGTSITGRAMESKTISVEAIDIRDYSKDKHRHVDDAPYGGGAGMVMQPGPVCEAYEALCGRIGRKPRLIYMTPQGRVFNQTIAEELAKEILEELKLKLSATARQNVISREKIKRVLVFGKEFQKEAEDNTQLQPGTDL